MYELKCEPSVISSHLYNIIYILLFSGLVSLQELQMTITPQRISSISLLRQNLCSHLWQQL